LEYARVEDEWLNDGAQRCVIYKWEHIFSSFSLSLFQVELLVMKALSLGLVKGRHCVGKGRGGQG